jgi:hypothetical protein
MSQRNLNRKERKAIRIAATIGATILPNHESIPKFPFSMFGTRLEEEHLVYRRAHVLTPSMGFELVQALRTPEPPRMTCELCGEEVELHPYMQVDGRAHLRVCHTCKTTRVNKCDKCHSHTAVVTMVTMKDGKAGAVCQECLGSYYSPCDVCGKIVYDGLHNTVNGLSMCRDCVSEYKAKNHYCGRCGKWIPQEAKMTSDAGVEVCPTCFAKEVNAKVNAGKPLKKCKGYSSTGGQVFFSTEAAKILFLGAEVEVTNGHYPDDYDRSNPEFAQALEAFQEMERKSDGSVSLGHEIATQAMEIRYHQNFFQWKKMMELHIQHGFDGHDSPHAGLHIHGSLAFFGERATAARNLKLGKLLFMLDRQDWRDNWKKFSRRDNKAVRAANIRDPWGYCQWYDIDWDNTTLVAGLEKAMSNNRQYRNRVLNFYNHHSSPVKPLKTVEWRGLKSHANYRVILAAIEMMDLLCRIAESKITEAAIRAMTWKQLCKKVPNSSPDLVWYLQSKHLWER